jgi:hypothetical protein
MGSSTLESLLLRSSLLCGQSPGGTPAYRLQLFLVANKHLGSKNHQNDFQRAIETGVKRGLWENHASRGSGDYLLTLDGHHLARKRHPDAPALYSPCPGKSFRARISGHVGETHIELRTLGRTTTVAVNGSLVKSAREACRILASREGVRLKTMDESAVRVLTDYGIDSAFVIDFT